AKVTGSRLEVNLFYRTEERELAISNELERQGAEQVLGVGSRASALIPELQSERRRVDPEGIFVADTVFVPLEDGDRTEALAKMGKNVIAVDLNPLSRTAKAANITIVDNVIRAVPALVKSALSLRGRTSLKRIYRSFDNGRNLQEALTIIRGGV
ncbi:MAG: phosphopantothenate/pantothenate synthetase family protein, partial [Nitrososphaera sp.]